MIKLIQFKDTRAIWSDENIDPVPGFSCRTVINVSVLPASPMLQFNCKEYELASVINNIDILYAKVQQHYIKEIQLSFK